MKKIKFIAALIAALMLMSVLAVTVSADDGHTAGTTTVPGSGYPYSGYPYGGYPYSGYPYSGYPYSGYPYNGSYPVYGAPSSYPLTGYPTTIYGPGGTAVDVYPSYGYPVYVARPSYYPSFLPYPLPIVNPPKQTEPADETAEEPKWVNPFNDIPYDADYLEALVQAVVPVSDIKGMAAAFEADLRKPMGKTVMEWSV